MILRQIALLSTSQRVSPKELMRVSAALQKQVSRDFSPVWNIQASIDPFESASEVPAGYWKVTVMDKIDLKQAGGFHLDEQGQPYAEVLWSPTWSLSASHETLEMLVDPFAHQLVSGASLKAEQGRVNYLVEVCDPCESAAYAYKINTGSADEVVVSDFYTPSYFDPNPTPGKRYSFNGSIAAPRQVLTGGYISWQNPADGHLWQLFGPIQNRNFEDHGPGTLNREHSDHLARKFRAQYVKRKPDIRMVVASADPDAPATCNLTRAGLTNVLNGVADANTTFSIKDETGQANFVTVTYDGQTVASDNSSATFKIKSGKKALGITYNAPINFQDLELVDPCGGTLDQFPNDKGNPNLNFWVNA